MLYHSSNCLIFTLKNLNVSPKSSWTLPLSDYCQLLEDVRTQVFDLRGTDTVAYTECRYAGDTVAYTECRYAGDTVAYTECRYAGERGDRVAALVFHLIFIWRNWKTRKNEGKWEWRENPRCDAVESSPRSAGPWSCSTVHGAGEREHFSSLSSEQLSFYMSTVFLSSVYHPIH